MADTEVCQRCAEILGTGKLLPTRDVGKYIKGCNLCQRMKNRMEKLAGKLKLSEVPKKP